MGHWWNFFKTKSLEWLNLVSHKYSTTLKRHRPKGEAETQVWEVDGAPTHSCCCASNGTVIMVRFQQLPLSLAPTWPEPDLEKDKLTRVQISAPTSIQYDLFELKNTFW